MLMVDISIAMEVEVVVDDMSIVDVAVAELDVAVDVAMDDISMEDMSIVEVTMMSSCLPFEFSNIVAKGIK